MNIPKFRMLAGVTAAGASLALAGAAGAVAVSPAAAAAAALQGVVPVRVEAFEA